MKSAPVLIFTYAVFIFGGLWNALGWFEEPMRLAAPWLILITGIVAGFSLWLQTSEHKKQIFFWTAGVYLVSLGIEMIGVNTGFPFGVYRYGEAMGPFIWQTPIAIGGAWISVVISCVFTARLILERLLSLSSRPILTALLSALLAVGFDILMEVAAVKLGYWSWSSGVVPFKNYFSWFVLSFLFSFGALRLFASRPAPIAPVWHLFPAQLIYFSISLL